MARTVFGLLVFILSYRTTAGTVAADPPAPEENSPFAQTTRWLADVRSLHLRVQVTVESPPDAVARHRRELRERFPELKNLDPLTFTGLLPELTDFEEWAFDGTRLRRQFSRHAEGRERDQDLRIWDGRRATLLTRRFRESHEPPERDQYRLTPTVERVADGATHLCFLPKQPPVHWWNRNKDARAHAEAVRGNPADFVPVGRDTFHGVRCRVLLHTTGNQTDRYYVGEADGRWYGAKEGIADFPPGLQRAYQAAVEEFLGRRLGPEPSEAEWAAVNERLAALTAERKAAWHRLHYERVGRHLTPVFDYAFSDYRELGGGRAYPYREERTHYRADTGGEPRIESRHTVIVLELTLDRPLGDNLFQEPLTEGALVTDETHSPRLRYTHRAARTPAEWQAIVRRGAEEAKREEDRRRAIARLIGKAAPPLPSGEWLGSKPLAWADLRGRAVVLKFWSVTCAPCAPELGVLRHSNLNASKDDPVYIGVHAAGHGRDEVEAFAAKRELRAPLVIDRRWADSGVGAFFDALAVDRVPTTIAVDEEGRVLTHGTLVEALEAIAQRRSGR